MDFTGIMQAICTVGFPIVAFFVAVYGLKYAFDKSQETNGKAFEELHNLADAVNHNTEVLANLVQRLENSDDDK